jgi:hypothetical protein
MQIHITARHIEFTPALADTPGKNWNALPAISKSFFAPR